MTERLRDIKTKILIYRETNWQRDREKDREMDRGIDKDIDRQGYIRRSKIRMCK
jgi:hypothetical protein